MASLAADRGGNPGAATTPAATLIYDGGCAFCRRWVERARRWDRRQHLVFVPLQTPDLEERFPTVSRAACKRGMHLVDPNGQVFFGAAAGREVLRRLPGGGLWSLPFRLPGGLWIAARLYEWITHRWGPLPRSKGTQRQSDGFHIAGSPSARAVRAGALTSVLSLRYLWAKLRARFARPERGETIMDDYHLRSAEQVVELMGNMKGLMMKLGQIMSFISDDVPEEYRNALRQLQTSSPPMSFELAQRVIEEDLGAPLSGLFESIEAEPMAAASIGQVHRARLSSGEDVVVKVQYPGVDAAIRADLTGFSLFNGLLGMMSPGLDPQPLAEELRNRISEELDYGREALNQRLFAELFDGHPFVRIPAVYSRSCGPRVLTSARADGHPYDWLLRQPESYRQRVGEILFRFVFGSIFRFHIFNADPHPGNYFFHDDGTVTFLDFGCVKYFPTRMVSDWKGIVSAHLRGDREAFRNQAIALGFLRPESDLVIDVYFDFMRYFYAPFARDEPFTFTPEYNGQSLGMMFDRGHPVGGEVQRKLNLPPHFVMVNRLQWGLNSILGQLGARANWHRIMREYLYDEPPATELGRQAEAFRERWKQSRGIRLSAKVWVDEGELRCEDPEQGSMRSLALPGS